MDQWRDFPLPDGSYSDATRPWTQQDVCNYLPTIAEQSGTRSRIKYACAPGMLAFCTAGQGPHRGAHNVEGKLFVVSGEALYQVFVTGNVGFKGVIPGTGPVSMTHNQIDGGNQLLIGTGDSSYVYNTKTGQLHQNDNVPLQSVDFLNQLCLGVDVGRRFWRYSGLADARTWNTLDNESAESSPDLIVGLKVSQGEVVVFGKRTAEIWSNTPTEDTAFQRNVVIEKGCVSAQSIQRLDNSLFWLGDDGIPYRLQGYQPVPIAPKSLVNEFLSCDIQNAKSYTFEDKGYVIYYLTFPDGRTWGYDVTTQRWHRRQSFGLDRWRLNTLVRWYDGWYGGDYSNGKLYRLEWGNVYEGCEIMPRSIRTGVLHNTGNRISIHGLRLNLNSGTPQSVTNEPVPTISGNLPDLTVGDSVLFPYTITTAYPGQAFTLSLTGTLPTGLSLSSTGVVSGTVTAEGVFSWTITVSTSCADGALADGNQVSDAVTVDPPPAVFTRWWMTSSHLGESTKVWESSDLSGPWGTAVERTPAVATPDFGPISLGLNRAMISGAESTLEWIEEFDPADGYATTTKTLVAGIKKVRQIGGYTFAIAPESATYWVSADNGDTWTSRATFGTRKLQDIARLASGRWIGFVADGANSRFVYSDDTEEPLSWQDSTVNPTASMCIVTNGTVACGVEWSGGVRRTEDGLTWGLVPVDGITATGANTSGVAVGDVFLMTATVSEGGGYLIRSTDAGQTWVPQDSAQIMRMETDGSVIVQSFTVPADDTAGARYSTDLGATWNDIQMPYTTGQNDGIRVAAVRYTA